MTPTLAQIWRHPIKAHGFEALEETWVKAGETLPWDRIWAVTHEASKNTDGEWASCANFSRGAKAPHLMALAANLDTTAETVTLSHPEKKPLTFQPDLGDDVKRFIEWIAPLMPEGRAASAGILRATDRGMTDSSSATISLGNLATLRALEQFAGQPLDTRRFRINFWIEGLAPYEELEWLEREFVVGDVLFRGHEPIERCSSTMANPETGRRDADPLAAMNKHWGHQNLGITVYAESSGTVCLGDKVALR